MNFSMQFFRFTFHRFVVRLHWAVVFVYLFFRSTLNICDIVVGRVSSRQKKKTRTDQ